jgi:hypothetical protein
MDAVARHRPAATNPLGVIAVMCTATGAFLGVFLWLFHFRPASALLGDYAWALAHGGEFRDQMLWLTATLGAVGIVAAVLAVLGGGPKPSTIVCIALGAIALSYPVLALTGAIGAPIAPPLFRG